jgi:hypothetical protein
MTAIAATFFPSPREAGRGCLSEAKAGEGPGSSFLHAAPHPVRISLRSMLTTLSPQERVEGSSPRGRG